MLLHNKGCPGNFKESEGALGYEPKPLYIYLLIPLYLVRKFLPKIASKRSLLAPVGATVDNNPGDVREPPTENKAFNENWSAFHRESAIRLSSWDQAKHSS
jgi:hypothetical protein